MEDKKQKRENKKITGQETLVRRSRFCYAVIFMLLLSVEVMIALYVHDAFVRPYLGDVLAVMVVYCFVRIFLPGRIRLLPLYVFCFAAVVEVLQYFRLAEWPCFADSRFLRVLLGSVFDWKDILCYAAGCALLFGFEFFRGRGRADEKICS